MLDTFQDNDITVSLIPGGCTGLVQLLDVSINRPFKDILKVEKPDLHQQNILSQYPNLNFPCPAGLWYNEYSYKLKIQSQPVLIMRAGYWTGKHRS